MAGKATATWSLSDLPPAAPPGIPALARIWACARILARAKSAPPAIRSMWALLSTWF